jgi:S1-C subfamily serine protease
MRPTGVPVPASGMRPAGIALQGVSAFGAGLRDGDVVTSVAGAPARSVGAVVGAVMGALRAKAKVITGVVWRGNQQLTVTVEIPWGKVQPRSKRD